MDRKSFLKSSWALTIPSVYTGYGKMQQAQHRFAIAPPALKPGDWIGITCPAGFIAPETIQPAIDQLQAWGYRVKKGKTLGMKDHSFGGTDAARAADWQEMMDDPSIRAILPARGGYGTIRMLDALDFTGFQKQPKWIIGFSDLTVMHTHVYRHTGIASLHAKMANSFPAADELVSPEQVNSIDLIHKALSGQAGYFELAAQTQNRSGIGEGPLIGGNLAMLQNTLGTASAPDTTGCLLFLEDTGEYLYSIDRMFRHLHRAGMLSRLSGLIIGGFRIKPDDPGEEFGRSLYDIVHEITRPYAYPVCFDFPVGHQKDNRPLKCGIRHRLSVNPDKVLLEEIR